jgi:hypothetical protein
MRAHSFPAPTPSEPVSEERSPNGLLNILLCNKVNSTKVKDMRRWASRTCGVLLVTGCASAPSPQPVAAKPSFVSVQNVSPVAASKPRQEAALEDGPGLTEQQVSEVLVSRTSLALGGCHAVEYGGRSPEPGFVVVDLAIERDGRVKSARVSESSYRQGSLPQCVASVTRELNFPPASGDTEVTWRFDFKGK